MQEENSKQSRNVFKSIFSVIKKILGIIIKTAVIAAVVAAALCVIAYFYWNANKPVDLEALYPTIPASKEDVAKQVLATGNVRSKESRTVYVDVTQKVSKVHVKEGDVVSAGQVLIDYDISADVSDLQRKLSDASANLESAQYNLELITLPAEGNELLGYISEVTSAEKNLYDAQTDANSLEVRIAQQQRKIDDANRLMEKNKEQFDGGILPENDYDNSVSSYELSVQAMSDLEIEKEAGQRTIEIRQRQVEDAKTKLSNAENKMGDRANEIKYQQQLKSIELIRSQMLQIQSDINKFDGRSSSPIDGYILSIAVKDGELAPKGAVLMEIADTSTIQVMSEISEYDAPQLTEGMKAEITTSGLPGEVFKGEVSLIPFGAVKKEKSSGDEVIVPVEFNVDNLSDKLKIGYSVDIAITTEMVQNVLAVSIQSVLVEGDEHYVYLLKNGELEKKKVTPGFYGDRTVEVKSGLAVGDPIIMSPADVVPPGNGFLKVEMLVDASEWVLKKIGPYVEKLDFGLSFPVEAEESTEAATEAATESK
ncbi:MAG: efflux RND transporter periplasmic adaptor subunit [Clostridiales bacterium]|nr:efflux RND transporter periplasmic adaptor subunit [Clostridiales bacterium]